jgi:hypothetical protein
MLLVGVPYHPPPPPPLSVSIERLLATQNELMRVLMENLVQCEVHPPHSQPGVGTSYTNFLAMHPLTFAEATDPLKRIIGFTSPSPSLGFCTAMSSRRLCLWPGGFENPRVLGGITSPPLFRTATRCHGLSSAQPSVDTTSPRA